MMEMRVVLRERCLINPPPEPEAATRDVAAVGSALLALFIPKLIEAAINGIANALKAAGKDRTDQLTAAEFADLYLADQKQALAVNPALNCVLAVWFDPDRDPPADDAVVARLRAEGLVPPAARVGGVYEAVIRATADGTAFFLDTRHFSVREFIGGRGDKDRDYIVTLALTTPNATAEGATFAIGVVDLGLRRRGDSVIPMGHPADGFPRFRSNLMPWSKISDMSKATYDRDVGANQAAGRRYMPVTFSLTVSETEDGNAFLAKLGEILSGLAEKSAAEISKAILPKDREEAAAADAERAEKLVQAELEAEKAALEAEKALNAAKPEDKPALEVALEIAKRKLAWQTRLREAAGLKPHVKS